MRKSTPSSYGFIPKFDKSKKLRIDSVDTRIDIRIVDYQTETPNRQKLLHQPHQ